MSGDIVDSEESWLVKACEEEEKKSLLALFDPKDDKWLMEAACKIEKEMEEVNIEEIEKLFEVKNRN